MPSAAATRRLTPAQTEGPYYPLTLPEDTDADLLRHPERDVPGAMRALQRASIDSRVEELICDDVRLARDALAGAPLEVDGVSGLLALAATIAWRQA